MILRALLAACLIATPVAASASDIYKVRVGPLGSESDARRLSAKLTALGISEAPRLTWN